jgi:hypothetical protein
LHNNLDERILADLEILVFDISIDFWSTLLCDEESFCSSSAFERNFGSVLQISEHKIVLDHALLAFIPVAVL